jgi:serine/threonine-protein kinase PknG
VVAALRAAPLVTVEVRLQVVRALVEADRVAEAVAELDEMERRASAGGPLFDPDDPETPAADDWRPGWYRGVAALAQDRAAQGREAFERVCDVLPGEAAPKLAVAVCAELAGDLEAARSFYWAVWRTDHAYVGAAFGLARALLAAGDRRGAVAVLHSVPETSSHHVAAQVAAVRAQAAGGRLADVIGAGTRLAGLELAVERRVGLTAELLWIALEALPGDSPASGRLLDCEVSEPGLRTGLERCYRQLARLADTPEERIALVDRANAVRPRTLV